jgi:hypothetical protein
LDEDRGLVRGEGGFARSPAGVLREMPLAMQLLRNISGERSEGHHGLAEAASGTRELDETKECLERSAA